MPSFVGIPAEALPGVSAINCSVQPVAHWNGAGGKPTKNMFNFFNSYLLRPVGLLLAVPLLLVLLSHPLGKH